MKLEILLLVKVMITQLVVCFLYFKSHCKLIAIDLSKQQKLDPDPKATQQINFSGNLDPGGVTQIFLISEEMKVTDLDISKGTVKVLWFYFISI